MEAKKEIGIAGLIERFAEVPDSRVVGRTAHDLLDIMVLSLCAVMSGAAGWDDIEDWGREREGWLRQYLPLRNGIPGHDTIRRVFEAILPQAFGRCFEAWMHEVCPAVADRVIAIDGKALRGSARAQQGWKALHQVSAYAADYGLTLGQRTCAAKSNEITAMAELLPALALEGAVVTIDAIGCQTALAAQITDGGGDYVLAVKENQPQLAFALRDFFSSVNAPGYCRRKVSIHETLDKGHGRIETRRCLAVGELDWLELLGLKARWPKLASVACIESTREIGGRTTTEKRYVLSSLPADSRRLLHAVRTHWGIETGLHWCLDVTFGEDASLIRLRNAAQNFAFLRRLALNLFRADKSRSISLPRKLKTAAYNPDYLATALKMTKI
jgi:predicted transposase YbfD/YdcC